MPWSPSDAIRHTHKARSAKQQRQWSDVANSALKRTGDDATAVREANGVIAKHEFTAEEEKRQRQDARRHRGHRG
jgi:uncharacterized protein (DUF1015 family)